jgi:hypothetical protein
MRQLLLQRPENLALLVLLAVSVLANLLIHWLVICPKLYRHGARFPTGLLPWRVFQELRAYKAIQNAEARTLTFYYAAFLLAWFNLLLALGLALRLLWQRPYP